MKKLLLLLPLLLPLPVQAQSLVDLTCVPLGPTTQPVSCRQAGLGNAGYPIGANPDARSAVGTTAATSASIPAVAGAYSYLCGFTIVASATAATSGAGATSSVQGNTAIGFVQQVGTTTAPAETTRTYNPCLRSVSINSAVGVTSIAAGTGGNTSVYVWGYEQ